MDWNNLLDTMGAEEAGIKVHPLKDGLIEENLCRDNNSRAIWVDNHNTNTRVTGNVCRGNPAQAIR